ncbi:MAG: hypothetical protein WAV86_09130 [Lutibacter sp.]
MHNLRGAKTRNNERNTLLLRAFAICDNPLYDLKLIGLLVKTNLWFVETGLVLAGLFHMQNGAFKNCDTLF